MSLLTAQELAGIQEMAELGMISTVTIFRRTAVAPASDEYDDELTYVEQSTTVKGWVRHNTPDPLATVGPSGTLGTPSTYRLMLPVGTDISTGDRVEVDGKEFVVSDTTAEQTWPAYLAVSLRRKE